MIRLDGNSLAAFRGAGVAGTVQRMAGCELFGEARGTSPYSAAATRALKAQFPTQWPTIRDYGFAHPALVPFINEDPMLVMSLIDGLGERWLVTDGASYINTGYASETDNAKFRIIYKQTGNADRYTGFFGSQKVSQDTNWNLNPFYSSAGMKFEMYLGSSVTIQSYTNVQNQVYDFVGEIFSNHTAILTMNGTSVSKNWSGTISQDNANIALFTLWNGSNYTARLIKNFQVSLFYIENNGVAKRNLVPCKHIVNGNLEIGMLDTINVVFYQNAGSGSFTISESPS